MHDIILLDILSIQVNIIPKWMPEDPINVK